MNMKEEPKKVDDLVLKPEEGQKMRQIIIETNGNDINLVKAEVSGKIEMIAIFQSLIGYLNQQK